MSNEDLNTELYMKMFSSQEAFKNELLLMPPEEILKKAYEYTIREDILLNLEYNDISDEQAKALMSVPDPLAEVFQAFEQMESDQMAQLMGCIESKANEIIVKEAEALRNLPLYRETAQYAKEHGELDPYRESMRANIKCRTAIEDAIHDHYRDNRLDVAGAKDVLKRFGPERTCYVLAATVQDKDWDGRISDSNKTWAKGFTIPQDKTVWDSPSYRRFVVGNAHPGLIDLFVNQVRRELEPQKERKATIAEKLKSEPKTTSPKISAKLKDPER